MHVYATWEQSQNQRPLAGAKPLDNVPTRIVSQELTDDERADGAEAAPTHAQGGRTKIGNRGVAMQAESTIGATVLADRQRLSMTGAVPTDSEGTSLMSVACILRPAG
jgi:hypothetical protein